MVEPPADVAAREGEMAEFNCRLTPCMPAPTIRWYYSEPGLTAQSDRAIQRRPLEGLRYQSSVTVDGLVCLLIVDVRLSDAGVYTMSADSSAGTVEVSAVLTVHGQCVCRLTS